MRRERAVDLFIEQDMLTRQTRRQARHRFAGRSVARVPRDLERPPGLDVGQEPLDIGIEHGPFGHAAGTLHEITGGGDRAELADVSAVDRSPLQHHLEAVIFGWIVGTRHHDGPIAAEMLIREIEHRRRAHADAENVDAGRNEALGESRRKFGRAQSPVLAECGRLATLAANPCAECATERKGVVCGERVPHNAANIIFAQDRRLEGMRFHGTVPSLVEVSHDQSIFRQSGCTTTKPSRRVCRRKCDKINKSRA